MADCNDPDQFELSFWDQIAVNWFYRVAGETEVHLKIDPWLGWEVFIADSGHTPSFFPAFSDALRKAEEVLSILWCNSRQEFSAGAPDQLAVADGF